MVVANGKVDLEALKSRNPLGDVVEASGVQLKGRGRVRQGVCPFHDEAEGSFTTYEDSQRYFCFGCGDGGDVLDFIQRMEGLTLPEAIQRLGGGPEPMTRAAVSSRAPVTPRRSRAAVVPQRDPSLLTAATWHYLRSMLRSREAREYLATRGIGFNTACRLGLGYAPGDGLRQRLEAAGFGGERLRASGLFAEHGAERFAGMVVVPDLMAGRVRWLVGRATDPDVTPRFQALPGPKPVLGLGRLGPAPPWTVLTEGLFDWLALVQWGLPAVAALGTQGVERVAASLLGCRRVFLAFDADDAGREAAERLEGLLGWRAVTVPLLGAAPDVAELATHPQGRAVFLYLLARAAHAVR